MADTDVQKGYKKKKNMYYILAIIVGYILPLAYFAIKQGVVKEVTKTSIVMPVLLIGFVGVMKIAGDIPHWVATWEPSLKKGLVKAIPKVLLFIMLITLGLTLKYMLEHAIQVAFAAYFETVLVLFGGLTAGAVLEAFHLKYRELYLISKGYVLGTINK